MRMLLPPTLVLALVLAAPATAEVVRLTPAERDAVIAAAAMGPERNAVLTPETTTRSSVLDRPLYPEFYGDTATERDRRVHGEVSMFAGSHGTFGVSGTAMMPVGANGSAAISVMQGTSRWGGLQGFSLGYASDGNIIGNGFGGPFGPGLWTTPWGLSPYPGMPPRRRR